MEDTKKLKEKLAHYEKENEDLKLKVEELTDFFENASMPLHWVDGEGIIIWANQAELDALGYAKEEYIGFPISNFHADQEVIQDILTRLTNNETLLDYSAKLQCKDGSIKHVLINSNVLRKNGKFVHTRCFTRDITEKIREDQRKSDFVSLVSHELKTPLTTISSYSQLLMKNTKKDEGINFQAATKIQAQAKKMTAMIHDFLNLARVEEGQIRLNEETFELYPLVEEITGDARILDTKHKVRLIDCEAVTLFADREKIGQVLMNLLSNAIKYSPMGGTITIGCRKQPGKVNIYVSDEGLGISKTDQKRLFERFYRVTNDKVKTIGGFGIGLYLVAEILRQHNSQIQVYSQEDEGSTFHFDLEMVISNKTTTFRF
ncbi:PAS domain S-box-containing protein [Pedobacter sp. W3I1]|uniref:PAS domain-containing sensor histidine kinase n=1 Tax=Pedobacter sp. W3I1 TaxID=3042291 RepID=UPI00278ACDB6|nr:ATP-binding protein [Pedobacter sp. W3I1]MDQ0638715.1 PAS domain S-box-containing protein [Pedobacter sp. W3I1]